MPPHTIMLAIETSQRAGGVALRTADGATDVEPLRAARRHDDDLIPAIDRLCRRRDIGPGDLAAVGVSIGPGGFTGLRISVATAKMLAETTGAALVPVPSALVVAETGGPSLAPGPIIVALAAKGTSFWATTLRQRDGVWRIDEGGAGLVEAARLDLSDVRAVVADEHFPDVARDACVAVGVAVVPPSFDPLACLAVAERLRAAGATCDALALAPLYPRRPEAVSLWEARRGG